MWSHGGWSFGGIIRWHWADRYPDRVAGLVTVDAFPVEVLAANPNVTLSAKVASNHSKILRNDSAAVARAVGELDEVRHG
jgi:pimeloyl-ACP methyl ester carboxylesterase